MEELGEKQIRNMTTRNLFQEESDVEIAGRRVIQWFGHIMKIDKRKLMFFKYI